MKSLLLWLKILRKMPPRPPPLWQKVINPFTADGLFEIGPDFADLYFEFRTAEALSLEEGHVKKANKDVSQGVGVRVVAGEKTGYAYTDEVTLTTLAEAARTAGHIASGAGSESVARGS